MPRIVTSRSNIGKYLPRATGGFWGPLYLTQEEPEDEFKSSCHFYYSLVRAAKAGREADRSPAPPDETGWGVPDWRDPTCYPEPDELSLTEWRWEFLRRNHGYRLDFLRPQRAFSRFGLSKGRFFEEIYGLASAADPRLSTRRIIGGAAQGEKSRLPAKRSRPDGIVGDRVIFIEGLLIKQYAAMSELSRIIPRLKQSRHFFIRLDLSRDIKSQVEPLVKLAESSRRHQYHHGPGSVRKQRRNWPIYLRALDAGDCNATYTDMTMMLPSSTTRTPHAARDAFKAAEALRRQWIY